MADAVITRQRCPGSDPERVRKGNKLMLTIATEAQARSRHDILDFTAWRPADQCSRIDLTKQYAGIDVQAIYPAGSPPVRHMQGEPMEKTLAWAESEVAGFLRT
jgi:hypothetical protein